MIKNEAHGLSHELDVIHPHLGEAQPKPKRSALEWAVWIFASAVLIAVFALVGLVVGVVLKGP